eukprot:CAMPEP_0182499654 /NCGR_PEP_ID=MMETSP1321-20130603/7880_1 /TAXON_ID=91990 /ORGANISM="Bolidomonas sp., Strain RCC1657" /LENGTH=452 /DNA_ID=CAMNT_0024703889 /DNA_START=105 /DNA_END=1460 /DNA_ORIENTATION=-
MPSLSSLLVLPLLLVPSTSDFVFPDFNKTTGLVLNGLASTTSCLVGIDLIEEAGFKDAGGTAEAFGDVHGRADNFSDSKFEQNGEKSTMQTKRTVEVNEPNGTFTEEIASTYSTFGHRDGFATAKSERCSGRVRLTPSTASTVGSVFYSKRLPVQQGFDTMFEFAVSDHSRTCSEHMDPSFGLKHHTSCAVHGGDGMAFVIHGDDDGSEAIGGEGVELGYGGIKNGLAVEFDMWANVPSVSVANDDMFFDHISVHSNGANALTSDSTSSLGASRAHDMADGRVHIARVLYLPYIEPKYFDVMSANENLIPYIKDNGETKRVGTLAIFVDKGIEADTPILALPINLSLLLNLNQGLAYAGFTASTGEKWEKHDLLSWQWCDFGRCDRETRDSNLFDYHQQSQFYTARHDFNRPGMGYGGSQEEELPTKQSSPDTEPWGRDSNSRTASGYVNEL